MILKNARIDTVYKINSMKLDRAKMRRLEALGLTKGTTLKVLNRNGEGAVILMVRGSRLALGSKITEAIYIGEVPK
jgi:Fe2+ transport system protein A